MMLVIDRSSSMSDRDLADAKEAAKAFVGQMNQDGDQVGVALFAGAAEVAAPLSHDLSAVAAAIEAITTKNGTNIAAGIDLAMEELTGIHHNPGAKPVIVLLSDGNETKGDARAAANAARAQDIRVITIGLGGNADEDLLRSIASTETDYYFAPTSADLQAIYQGIAGDIRSCP
jgi:Ca-activated chloride channel homolog